MTAFVGISGWRYAPWRGDFYPRGLAQKRELEFAAERFATIELNGSFYSLQRPESYAAWREAVPDGFVFAIKGSRYITHMLRLRGVETALANFFASGLFELEDKLGPFLWQFPERFAYDRERLDTFFRLLPRTGAEAARLARKHDARVAGRARLDTDPRRKLRHAIEVRHPSFVQPEFIELLRKHEIALVVADTAGKWPLLEDVTADFVYVRLHGDVKLYESGYSDRALDHWARKVRAWISGRQPRGSRTASQRAPPPRVHRDVYVYFDNDIKVHAPYDAQRLASKLGALAASASAYARPAPIRARPSSDAARRARPRA
ncbi:MAG TPA: DUF72 domain-containing protein [Gammaproteobacteria bacterium]|nr:DUF72 domain-containing protein [Gammaproteobacteria bacterium]